MSEQNALRLLFELRAVLDRISQTDSSVQEAIARDVDEAMGLADGCIAELTEDDSENL